MQAVIVYKYIDKGYGTLLYILCSTYTIENFSYIETRVNIINISVIYYGLWRVIYVNYTCKISMRSIVSSLTL